MAHLAHYLCLAAEDVGAGVEGAVAEGVGEGGCDEGAVGAGELTGGSAEVLPCHGVDAVDAVAHLDGVEVYFHDAVLAPDEFDEDGEIGFEAFAEP